MSDVAAAPLVAAASVPDIPMSALSRPTTIGGVVWELFRAGWRPASGWSCVAVIFANGTVLPIARVFGAHVEPMDWIHMTPFAALLFAQAALRTAEKITGSSQ